MLPGLSADVVSINHGASLKALRNVIDEMIEHARAESPLEACGYLAQKDGVITAVFRMKNIDASAQHFSLDPAEQFAAVRKMRADGLHMAAVYHSHPASPARPSVEDIRLANDPDLKYLIVSLDHAEPDVKSFIIRGGQVLPDPIEIVEP